MKQDWGFCAECGQKNSKDAMKCHNCTKALPWAPKPPTRVTTKILPAKPTPPATHPVSHVSPSANTIYCNACGLPNVINAVHCSGCGSAITSISPVAPSQVWGTHDAPPPPSNINVTVSQQNNSGWWLAWFLLLFATPVGCITIPLALFLIAVFAQWAPIIIACVVVGMIYKSPLEEPKKSQAIVGAMVVGAALQAVLLAPMYQK
jgi:hypothetical protein